MKRIEEMYECDVCGEEHIHSVERYTFDSSNLGLGELLLKKRPVTLVVDEYGDWRTEVDDGYTQIRQTWEKEASVIIVDVVEKVSE